MLLKGDAMPKEETVLIGQSVQRIDAVGKVTGVAVYPADIDRDDQLWAKIVYSQRAHAEVVSLNLERALALEGVITVLTSADVPVNEYGLVISDQPVLCGPESTIAGGTKVRCYMDHVAVVVAKTAEIATQAAQLVEVDYQNLPATFNPEEAMLASAPQLHADTPNNILCHYRIRFGDVDAAFEQADVIVEGEYSTTYQEHAYLQPEAGLGYIDEEGRITIVVAGQWTHEDREQIAHALNLPEDQIRVIYPAIGGAFGGREDMSVQIILALAVQKTRQPVKIIWDREESIRGHHKRHPITVWAKWGATRAGKVVAVEARLVGDAGAYNYTSNKVMGNANLMATGPYEIPNVKIDTFGVYTNNIPTGAFRGFGAPQAAFAAEGQMNKLAAALGLDPLEIRLRNTIQEGSILSVGTPLPKGVSMPQVFEAAGSAGGWERGQHGWERAIRLSSDNPYLRRGVGLAGGFKNIGFSFGYPERSWAAIELYGEGEIETVIVRQGAADVGQGVHTLMVQMAADAVGVPFEKVRLLTADTAKTENAGSASASRLTFMAGNAIRGAAQLALQKWQDEERPAKAEFLYRPPKTTPYDPLTGRSEPNFAYGYVAQVVEVEVDIETGQIWVRRVISVNDVGRAVNPQQVEGQVEGAVAQALGYALMENLVSIKGVIQNPHLSTYLIPTALDMPMEVQSVILEYPDPIGPWGARGMAEMPMIPLLPAIAAAVHDATGVWLNHQPFTPDKVMRALREQGIGVL